MKISIYWFEGPDCLLKVGMADGREVFVIRYDK